MDSVIQVTFWNIFNFLSKILARLFFGHDKTKTRADNASRFDTAEKCGYCSTCIAAKRKLLEEKCLLVENYIVDNLGLQEHLDHILQLQQQNIDRQLALMKNLNSSSEHLQAAISDCLEKHLACVNQFAKEMGRLEIDQKIEAKVAIASYEGNTEEFKKNLLWNVVNNEKRTIAELLED